MKTGEFREVGRDRDYVSSRKTKEETIDVLIQGTYGPQLSRSLMLLEVGGFEVGLQQGVRNRVRFHLRYTVSCL